MTILALIGTVFIIPLKNILKLSASAAASELCELVEVALDVYIPHHQYQVKPHSCLWFSAAFAAAIVQRNHFSRFPSLQKGFLKLPNLHMLIKQNSPSLSRNLTLETFGKLPMIDKGKSASTQYILYLTAQKCCLLHMIKQNCLLKTFLKTLILMTQVSLYLFFLLELI